MPVRKISKSRTTSKTSSKTKTWASKPARVKKIESKMNLEQKKAKKAAETLNKLKRDFINACRGEIKVLKSKPVSNKSTKTWKNTQKKIQVLNREIGKAKKKNWQFKAA